MENGPFLVDLTVKRVEYSRVVEERRGEYSRVEESRVEERRGE